VEFANCVMFGNEMSNVSNCFMYSVVLAHGFRLIGNSNYSFKFTKLAYATYKKNFFSDTDEMIPISDVYISSLCLLIDLEMQIGEFVNARRCVLQLFNTFDSCSDEIHPMLSHRVYAYMAGISRNKSDLHHWVENANNLSIESCTPINRVFLSFFHCSPGLLRSKNGKLFSEDLKFPENRNKIETSAIFHYQEMITELMTTEEVVMQYKNANLGNDMVTEYANACLTVVYGCRAIVFAMSGNRNNAYICASRTLEITSALGGHVMFQLVPISIAYALKVLLHIGYHPMFEEGMEYLNQCSNCYPNVDSFIMHLRSSSFELKNEQFDFSRI